MTPDEATSSRSHASAESDKADTEGFDWDDPDAVDQLTDDAVRANREKR
jgi:hypothetical protein